MKEYRDNSGEQRIWYEESEIDQIMERELTKAGLLPDASEDDVSVEIESFVESHLGIPFDQYAKLESDTLGVTRFVRGKPPTIEINRDLTISAFEAPHESPGALGRWRSTVAHEIGHVLLHRRLFHVNTIQGLPFFSNKLASDRSPSLMRCLKRNVGYCIGATDWREVQANMAIGALLMPRPIFAKVVAQEEEKLLLGPQPIQEEAPELRSLVSAVARRFQVSKASAKIRIEGIGRIERRGQSSFGFS